MTIIKFFIVDVFTQAHDDMKFCVMIRSFNVHAMTELILNTIRIIAKMLAAKLVFANS